MFWGWLIWNELPAPSVAAGTILIVGSALFVFARERVRGRPLVGAKRVHRVPTPFSIARPAAVGSG